MSNLQSNVVLRLGDGMFSFALKCRQLENLEKLCDAPISDIAMRVMGFRPTAKDLKHIIILGLEGGGMPPEQALAHWERYVDGRPIFPKNDESAPALVCARIMEAVWFGIEDIPKPRKARAAASPAKK